MAFASSFWCLRALLAYDFHGLPPYRGGEGRQVVHLQVLYVSSSVTVEWLSRALRASPAATRRMRSVALEIPSSVRPSGPSSQASTASGESSSSDSMWALRTWAWAELATS